MIVRLFFRLCIEEMVTTFKDKNILYFSSEIQLIATSYLKFLP